MSLLATEAAFSGLSSSIGGNNGGKSGGILQDLIKDPLNLFYKLYQSTTSNLDQPESTTQPTPEDSSAQGSSPSTEDDTPPQQRRLHPNAETYRSSLMAGTASVVLKRSGRESDSAPQLEDLPVPVLLHIASFMDAKSLCQLQQTNKYFNSMMSDELLWRRKLVEDSHKWSVMSHLSHPRVYEETATDKTAQEIYSSCYQNRDSAAPSQNFLTNPVTHTLRYIMRRIQGRVPRLVVFGSGLESVPLIKLMIMETNSPYKPIGLFPGKDGIGAGICVKHKDTSINLVTLYTATRAERLAASSGQVKRVNKLISAYAEDDENAPELTRSVQEQCQAADGFILIVNASKLNEEEIKLDTTMINAMLKSGNPRNALLVLSCTIQSNTNNEGATPSPPPSADSSLAIADKLKLCDISCPWQVRNLNVSTFEELSDGFDWLLAATDN